MIDMRNHTTPKLVVALFAVCITAVCTAPALAVQGYTFSQMLGKEVNTSKANACLGTELANCKVGVTGSEPGQFNTPRGIAVDSATVAGKAGDVYVADTGNFRVQKLGPNGEFILMFGKEVNETKANEFNEAGNPHKITVVEENLCTQAEVSGGAKCKTGVSSTAPGETAFREPWSVAVDRSALGPLMDPSYGDVYVADKAGNRVQIFSPEGLYKGQLEGAPTSTFLQSVAVDQATGEVLATARTAFQEAFGFNDEGTYNGTKFRIKAEAKSGIAIDPLGQWYAFFSPALTRGSANGTVEYGEAFGSAAAGSISEKSFDTSGGTPSGVAVGAGEDVFVYDTTSGASNKYVAQFTPSDELVSEVGPGIERPTEGFLAINSVSGVLYASEVADARVSIFTPTTVPAVATEALAEPDVHGGKGTSAKLVGKVNTEGGEGRYYFEYGTTNAYTLGKTAETTITAAEAAAHSGGLNITTAVTTTAGTTYHYRLVACLGATACTATSALNYGADKTIAPRASEGPEGVETKPATNIKATEVTLNGSTEPNGEATEYHFKYGPCTSLAQCPKAAYPSSGSELSAGSASEAVSTPTAIAGLTPETIYHYKLIAKNKAGATTEALNEAIFITKPAVTAVKTLAPSNVTPTSANMNASLEPEGAPAEYFIEYGRTASYGQSTVTKTTSSGSELAVSEPLSGLTPLTVYHYRMVTKRVIAGKTFTVDGADQSFSTAGIAPEIQAEETSGVTPFSATLEATVNPGNSATTYYFVYGPSPTSEQALLPTNTVSGYGAVHVTPRVLGALQPDTTYYYHVVAENPFGQVEGVEGPGGPEEKSFTTLPASSPEVSLGPASEIGQTSASLTTMINPNGLATEYEIQLATNGIYTPVIVLSAGSETTPQTASYTLSGLAPATTYQVRIVAWNPAGETISPAQTLMTTATPTNAFTQPVAPVLVAFTPTAEPAGTQITTSKVKTKTKTDGQKLAGALKACRNDKNKAKRKRCEKAARKKYAHASRTKNKK